MWYSRLFFSTLTALVLASMPVAADQIRQSKIVTVAPSNFMRVYGTASPPFGFVEFCERMPAECQSGPLAENRVNASPARLSELDEVNRQINRQVLPMTDLDLYGVVEYWTVPTTAGDCEDYVLLKRHMLIERGWPSSALLITVVRDEHGEGHAILTARTAQGDYVLDNKTPEIKLWHQTGYRFVMRQSYITPRMWMSLEPGDPTAAPLTGNRR
jgi:predicted transglutaminase-like cysteine proteinase